MKTTSPRLAYETAQGRKGDSDAIPLSSLPPFSLSLVLCSLLTLLASTTHAVLPEPDNLLYGSIALDGVPVTAARTDVVIEARRTINGAAIASYRMGSNSGLGNLYALRLQLESLAPLADPNSSQLADTLFIVVTDGTGLKAQTTYTLTERGVAQRVDFGVAVVDSDGDGLPDAWELLYFPNLGQTANSPGLNGQTAWQNYLAGTNPNDTNSVLKLSITRSNDQRIVSFLARSATGVGYEGRSRFYALESRTNLGTDSWTDVPGLSALPGNDQILNHPSSATPAPAFFRVRVWLQP